MRISHLAIAAAAGLLMQGASAFAQQAQQTDQPADPNAIVCRAGEPITGSRLPGPRVCHTQKEWDQIRQDAQDALNSTQQRATQSNMPGS